VQLARLIGAETTESLCGAPPGLRRQDHAVGDHDTPSDAIWLARGRLGIWRHAVVGLAVTAGSTTGETSSIGDPAA
jgi:hypothetical protein